MTRVYYKCPKCDRMTLVKTIRMYPDKTTMRLFCDHKIKIKNGIEILIKEKTL